MTFHRDKVPSSKLASRWLYSPERGEILVGIRPGYSSLLKPTLGVYAVVMAEIFATPTSYLGAGNAENSQMEFSSASVTPPNSD